MPRPQLRYLTDLPLFKSLTDREGEQIAEACCRKSLHENTLVQIEGQTVGFLGILLCGRGRAGLFHADGRELVLHHLFARDCFGDTAILGSPHSPYTVICTGGTELLLVGLELVRAVAQRNHKFASAVVAAAERRQQEAHDRLRLLAFERGEERVAGYLQSLAARCSAAGMNGESIPPSVTHQMIADNCALTRETVSRAVSRLQQSGRIRKTRDGWHVAGVGTTARR